MDASEILIKNIKEEIPTILLGKFEAFDIKNLEEVLSLNLEEFGHRRGVGVTVLYKLSEFKERIRNDLEKFADLQKQNTKIHILPINETIIPTSNFLDLVLEVVTDYLNLLPERERSIINHLYGLNKADKFKMDNLSHKYSISSERIRQLRLLLLEDIRNIFKGEFNFTLRCHIRQSIAEEFSEIQKCLLEKRVFSFDELVETLRDKYSCENAKENMVIINLLIELFEFSKCKKIESIFTKAELVVVDPDYKKTFLIAADKTLRFLKKKITPINDTQAVIEIRRSNKLLQSTPIIDALNVLPEIEILESQDQTFYQAKFENLSSATDRAYRVLLERGDPMYIDDIVTEINHRLVHTGTSKIYNKQSLKLTSENRFVSKRRTELWYLKEWKKNFIR